VPGTFFQIGLFGIKKAESKKGAWHLFPMVSILGTAPGAVCVTPEMIPR